MRLITKKKLQGYLFESLSGNGGQTSLVITFVIMFLLVVAAFFLANTSFKNSEMTDYIGKSSKSFYASESGLEIFMYEKYKGTPLFVLDSYIVDDNLVCGCVTNSGTIKTAVANGTSAMCVIDSGLTDCNALDMHFNVEKITNADNNKVKSTGRYQNIERAVKIQW